jgi:hypothetical protein
VNFASYLNEASRSSIRLVSALVPRLCKDGERMSHLRLRCTSLMVWFRTENAYRTQSNARSTQGYSGIPRADSSVQDTASLKSTARIPLHVLAEDFRPRMTAAGRTMRAPRRSGCNGTGPRLGVISTSTVVHTDAYAASPRALLLSHQPRRILNAHLPLPHPAIQHAGAPRQERADMAQDAQSTASAHCSRRRR